MKRTLCQQIRECMGSDTLTLNEIAERIGSVRKARKDSIRVQLRGFIDKGHAEARRGPCGLLHYRLLSNVSARGGNPRLYELDQLLATVRRSDRVGVTL